MFFGNRSMDTVRRPFPDAFCRAPPCNPATPFEKGVDPKTFLRTDNILFNGRVKNPECRNRKFSETDLWIPCAVPSVGVLCSRAWWEASSENPWAFGDASRLHDLKRPSLFRRDEVPARNTHKIVRLRLHEPKKVFEGSKGRFFKNAPWQGVGQRPTKGGQATHRGTPFQAGQSPFTKHRQTVRLRLYEPEKVFEGSKGRFFKNAPWQGVGQSPTKGERASPSGHAFSGGTRFLYGTPTDRSASPLRTEKSF